MNLKKSAIKILKIKNMLKPLCIFDRCKRDPKYLEDINKRIKFTYFTKSGIYLTNGLSLLEYP